MEGSWYKRCPVCGTYMTKKDPQDICTCFACGWKEECTLFFCNTICNYCHLSPRTLQSRGLSVPGQGVRDG